MSSHADTKKYFFIVSVSFFLFCSLSCENDKNQKDIFDGTYDSSIFSINNFNNIKFKIYKEYDVIDLPDADSAYYGFWGTSDFERREFELRFYSSNDKAKTSGTFFAEEATGNDAIIKKSDASWKEGVKDRRFVGPFGTSKNYPKYLDYVIFGNVIVLCPSEKSESVHGAWDPIENCRKLLSSIVN
ncbi:MAG: DUF6810 family protein [Chloroflexota bacterium]